MITLPVGLNNIIERRNYDCFPNGSKINNFKTFFDCTKYQRIEALKADEELTDSHASNSYFKTLMWLEEGNLPEFVENDIKAFLKQNKQIEQKDKKLLNNVKNL